MKTIYRAGNITEAHIVAGMLEAEGIRSHVSGHHLQGGIGEIATMDFARVMIAEEDYEAALPLIAEYEANRHRVDDETVSRGMPDTSGDSGVFEMTEPAPGLGLAGIFTKPILFWSALLLLAFWFIF